MDELKLARMIATGDRGAMDQLVDAHYDGVYRYLAHLTRHRQDAEDLAQQCFLRARDKIATFRGDGSLRAWLFRLAYREYTHWRRRKTWLPWADAETTPQAEPGFEAVEEAAWLLDALAQLHPDQKQAFLLHEVQGFSVEETAVIVDSPVGTVKSRLHHARTRLGRAWAATQHEVNNELRYQD
ncbi:MAG: RNA polymerase sigma factor [Armatimonadetes bacterium]|nr:RNA polymerase sigma factor [Armatimonadota bacterium]